LDVGEGKNFPDQFRELPRLEHILRCVIKKGDDFKDLKLQYSVSIYTCFLTTTRTSEVAYTSYHCIKKRREKKARYDHSG